MAAGNATIWKPSPTTPLCSIAVTRIVSSVLEKNNIPGAVAGLVMGGKDVGEAMVQSQDVDMGASVFQNSNQLNEASLLTFSQTVSFVHWERERW